MIVTLALFVLFIVMATVLPILEAAMRSSRRAFSLVEVMIVVVIIGLMAAWLRMPPRAIWERAKRQRARSDVATYPERSMPTTSRHGYYPDNREG